MSLSLVRCALKKCSQRLSQPRGSSLPSNAGKESLVYRGMLRASSECAAGAWWTGCWYGSDGIVDGECGKGICVIGMGRLAVDAWTTTAVAGSAWGQG